MNLKRSTRAGISLAVRGALALAFTGGAAAASAGPLVLTAYSNAAGGVNLTTGDYATALDQLGAHVAASGDAADINNRCVALTVTRQLEEAQTACDAAVSSARAERQTLPPILYTARSSYDQYLALAYANRAVVHALNRDTAAAEADLARAELLAPGATFINLNRIALGEGATRQVMVETRR